MQWKGHLVNVLQTAGVTTNGNMNTAMQYLSEREGVAGWYDCVVCHACISISADIDAASRDAGQTRIPYDLNDSRVACVKSSRGVTSKKAKKFHH